MDKILLKNAIEKPQSGEWGKEDDTGNGIPVIRTTNFTNTGEVNYSNVVTRLIDQKKFEKKVLQNGDIIIEKSGGSEKQPVGRVIYFDGESNKFLFNNFTSALRVKNDVNLNSKYLFYYLFSFYKKGGTLKFQNKTTGLHNLKLDQYINGVTIPVIDLKEQERIVNVLDNLYTSIKLRQEKLDHYDYLIKSRFVDMFGDPFQNPMNWPTSKLEELIIKSNNGMSRRGCDEQGSIVLRLVELQDGYIDYEKPNRIKLNEAEKARYLLEENDFLFARVNGNPENVGRCAVFNKINEDVYHNDHTIRVHFNESILEGVFASTLLNSDYGKIQMKGQIKTSAGQYTISQSGIGAIVTILPAIELQHSFANFVKHVDKLKVEVQKSLDETQLLFDSLMQKYFD